MPRRGDIRPAPTHAHSNRRTATTAVTEKLLAATYKAVCISHATRFWLEPSPTATNARGEHVAATGGMALELDRIATAAAALELLNHRTQKGTYCTHELAATTSD